MYCQEIVLLTNSKIYAALIVVVANGWYCTELVGTQTINIIIITIIIIAQLVLSKSHFHS